MMEDIYDHCRQEYPYECCGLLIGDYDTKKVEKVMRTRNIWQERMEDRFEIDPEDLVKGEKLARDLSLDVIGYYHSHPDHPNEPSEFDRERAFFGMSYIIVQTIKGQETLPKSWVLDEETSQFTEEIINIT